MTATTTRTAFTGWAVDRDYIDLTDMGIPLRTGYGQTADENNPDAYDVTIRTDLRAADVIDPVRFRILDDDGEVYYGGAVSRSWLDDARDPAYAILKWAEADAGATDFQVRDADGNWETIYG